MSPLCATVPSSTMTHQYSGSILMDPAVQAEKVPCQIDSGADNFPGLESRLTTMFDPTGLQLADPVRHEALLETEILDYSNGKFPLTAKWLASYFGATVVVPTPTSPPPASGQQTYGLVVLLRRNSARRSVGPG